MKTLLSVLVVMGICNVGNCGGGHWNINLDLGFLFPAQHTYTSYRSVEYYSQPSQVVIVQTIKPKRKVLVEHPAERRIEYRSGPSNTVIEVIIETPAWVEIVEVDDEPQIVVEPPRLPNVVIMEDSTYYTYSDITYMYVGGIWRYNRAGHWHDLPRSHYPNEVRYHNNSHANDDTPIWNHSTSTGRRTEALKNIHK